ncbi:Tyrosine recombinase XerC [Methylobacterium tardum]|uniref:Integrase n=1 Tax=Methylobacterium tardum TaxID=374432 RepID=A0AA37TJ45_9HYPH|nr:Tyrosine recombinase XerC [Methylobacterium tardum]GLS72188.1 hypothetical protein GCM10007890_42010 [Methylobacterium tardum]
MRRADHLQCRRGRWSVRPRVPAHLVATVGQTYRVRSLDTSSEAVARERRWIALALLWGIGAQTVSDGWEPAWAAALTGSGRSRDDATRECPDPTPHPPLERRPRKGSQDHAAPRGSSRQTTILTTMERWLKEIEGFQTKQSRMQHALAVREFAQTQPPNCPVRRVDRRAAGEFVSGVLLRSGTSQATVNRKIASLSSMWQWLTKRGYVSDNPWQGQGSFATGAKREPAKRAYTADELTVLLAADPAAIMGQRYGTVLFDLMRIGLLTGCRISKLCQLRVSDVIVGERAFRISNGKTENARRIVPVHALAWPIMQRRLTSSPDGWGFFRTDTRRTRREAKLDRGEAICDLPPEGAWTEQAGRFS